MPKISAVQKLNCVYEGPAGPQGERGPEGPQGPQGPMGTFYDPLEFDDEEALSAIDGDRFGQIARVTKGGSWYIWKDQWEFFADGDFDPANPEPWIAGRSFSKGDLCIVPTQVISTGLTLAAGGDPSSTLDAADSEYAADSLNGCTIEILSGTGQYQKNKIIDTAFPRTITTRPWNDADDDTYVAPDATSVYEITWESGLTVFEAQEDHTAGSFFCVDYNAGKWDAFCVNHYHYVEDTHAKEFCLLDPDRADDWNFIYDKVLQMLDSRTAPGADERWGSGFARIGTVRFMNGNYKFHEEVKHLPRTFVSGPNTPVSNGEAGFIISALENTLVRNNSLDYFAIKSGYSVLTNEPGVGADSGDFWIQIANWNTSPTYHGDGTYHPGDVVTRNGSYYRCMIRHTPANDAFEPPSNGSTLKATGGDTWFRYWQFITTSVPSSWATGEHYVKGFDAERDEFLCRSVSNGADDLANACFQSGMANVRFNCASICRSGFYMWASHGSRFHNIDVDNFSRAGYRVAKSCDSFNIDSLIISKLGRGNPSQYGWWFDNDVIAMTILNPVTHRCEVGMSFGTGSTMTVIGYETENVGKPGEFRFKNANDFFGSAGDRNGQPNSVLFFGANLVRNADDQYTVSSDIAFDVRFFLGGSGGTAAMSFVLEGRSRDTSSNDTPYTMVNLQNNNSTKREYPLDHVNYKGIRGWKDFSFRFDLLKAIRNLHLLDSYTQVISTPFDAVIIDNNPALNLTGNPSTFNINVLPGIYRLEILAGNNYGTNYTVTFNDENGVALPGFDQVAPADLYWRTIWHPGGQIQLVIDNGASPDNFDADISVLIRPWLDFDRGTEVADRFTTPIYPS